MAPKLATHTLSVFFPTDGCESLLEFMVPPASEPTALGPGLQGHLPRRDKGGAC